MRLAARSKHHHAMTLLEIMVVCAVLAIFVMLLLPAFYHPHTPALRIRCLNNLKQVGLSFRVWAGDNNDRYPAQVPAANGGSMEYITGTNVWRHFQIMSNELSTPKILICPADTARNFAKDFSSFNNTHISFFYGIDATGTNYNMLLSGDRNITNGTLIKNGLLELTPNRPSGWTSEMHNQAGNLCLADGSVQQLRIAGLQTAVTNTSLATNRLQMPVLTP